tara:strand:+ start:50 stop:478 length:429 start_codon:yes stop_codon:yes gene_type:complete
MSAYSGQSPINAKDIKSTFASAGLLVKYHATGVEMTTAVTDKVIAVTVDESSRDVAGVLDVAGVGTVSLLPLTGVQYVKCITNGALKTGAPVYMAQTAEADGHCKVNDATNSATFIGYYFGEDAITPATGDLIPVFMRGAHI